MDSYIETVEDNLMRQAPGWFQAVIWIELLFQFPLFFVFAYAAYQGVATSLPSTYHLCSLTSLLMFVVEKLTQYQKLTLIYAVEAVTALVPIFWEMAVHSALHSTREKTMLLFAIYLYYIFSLVQF